MRASSRTFPGRAARIGAHLASLACLAAAAPLSAQAIGIAPVGISLAPGETTTVVRITNRDTAPAAVQVRPYAWDQGDGSDRLSATSLLLVSPPITTIAPGQTQIVRLLLKSPAADKETSYRILFDQIPTAATPGGVRIALRISIPVFALPAQTVRSKLTWQATATAPGEAELVVSNAGNRHARLSALRITAGKGAISLEEAPNFYVLPGAVRHLHLKAIGDALKPGGTLRVSASSDEGDIVATALLQARS